ncbi:MAG: type I pullulanase [Candidatus Izemoplasmatales bacterium]|jgi:pullulanase
MINDYFYPYLDDFDTLTLIIPNTNYIAENEYWLIGNNEKINLFLKESDTLPFEKKLVFSFSALIRLEMSYYIVDKYENKGALKTGKIVRTSWFDSMYAYDSTDLGVVYLPTGSDFTIWAPTAHRIALEIISKGNESITYEMIYFAQGTWKNHVEGNLEGSKYRYFVETNGQEHTVIDPYAIACSANAEYGFIVDYTKFVPMIHKTSFSGNLLDAIIYEVNVRDFTSDNQVPFLNRSRYSGLIEKGVKTPKGHCAGFDYLRELGITHIQLMPIFDFAGVDEFHPKLQYNWGYNPRQMMIPSGAYANNPNDPYSRINELRATIDEFHRENINVVMDFVGNHLFDRTTSNLEKLVPGYAFRVDEQGIATDYSGCLNDLATERKMIHKLVIDTVLWWAKTYKIDGFRFDLMGLIDIDTMKEIQKKLLELNPKIIVYGEGWKMHPGNLANRLASADNFEKLDTMAFFNDTFRDTIKGSPFESMNKGFTTGNASNTDIVKELLLGSARNHFKYANHSQSINYIECHDNQTFFDKAMAINNNEQLIKKQQKLANSITILAQGVPFLHAGQEFYRTKQGVRDSYLSGDDINQIDWTRLDDNYDDVLYLMHLITIRKANPGFHIKSVPLLIQNIEVTVLETKTVIYWLKQDQLQIIFKPEPITETIVIPDGYQLILASTNDSTVTENNVYVLRDICTYVFQNKG